MTTAQNELAGIVKKFRIEGGLTETFPLGTGHINETYFTAFKTPDGQRRYTFQRVNENVFKGIPALMENMDRVTRHLRARIEKRGGDPDRETLNLVPTLEGKTFLRDDEGRFWRAFLFIEGARTYDRVEDPRHIYGASKAFGKFQKDLSDLPGKRINEVIPGFHDTRKRFENLLDSVRKDPRNRASGARKEIEFAIDLERESSVIADLLERHEIPERIVHNDTKFNNVMIDDRTGDAVCIIDLDTVMPGSPLYDFGDSVRSAAASAAEDGKDLSKAGISLEIFEHIARGYLDSMRRFLRPQEIDRLAFSCKLITFECGIRFLTDYLDGDVYFRTHREGQSLDRCRVQFRMVSDMEQKMDRMLEIIEKHRTKN